MGKFPSATHIAAPPPFRTLTAWYRAFRHYWNEPVPRRLHLTPLCDSDQTPSVCLYLGDARIGRTTISPMLAYDSPSDEGSLREWFASTGAYTHINRTDGIRRLLVFITLFGWSLETVITRRLPVPA